MGLRHPVFVSRFAHNWDRSANLLWQKSDIFEILPNMDTVSILQVRWRTTLHYIDKRKKVNLYAVVGDFLYQQCFEMVQKCPPRYRAPGWRAVLGKRSKNVRDCEKWVRKISLVFLCRCTFMCVARCERVCSTLSSIARMCVCVCHVVQVWVALFC